MNNASSSPASAPKPPYSWSASETTELVVRYEAGASIDQLSQWSGRSPHHVVARVAWALCGVGPDDVNPLAPRFREPWSDEESQQLQELLDAGVTLDEAGDALERDLTDVAWHLVLTRKCRPGLSRAG